MRNQSAKDAGKTRQFPVTAHVRAVGEGVYGIVLDAPEDSGLAGSTYRVGAPDWIRAAEKAMRYAEENTAEANAFTRRYKRGGAQIVIDWRPAVLEGLD